MHSTRSHLICQPHEGEHLRLRPPARSGGVVIKVDPVTAGSAHLAMGTQHLDVGGRIPEHLHDHQEEILFVAAGRGTVTVGETRAALGAGTTVFIPPGVWHGVENDSDAPLQLVWVISPPGLEGMFRGISAPPGAAAEPLAPQEFAAIALRHGMRVRG